MLSCLFLFPLYYPRFHPGKCSLPDYTVAAKSLQRNLLFLSRGRKKETLRASHCLFFACLVFSLSSPDPDLRAAPDMDCGVWYFFLHLFSCCFVCLKRHTIHAELHDGSPEAAKALRKTFLPEDRKRSSWKLKSMAVIPKRREPEKGIILCMTGTRPGLTSEVHLSRQSQSNITRTLKTELTLEPHLQKVKQNFSFKSNQVNCWLKQDSEFCNIIFKMSRI